MKPPPPALTVAPPLSGWRGSTNYGLTRGSVDTLSVGKKSNLVKRKQSEGAEGGGRRLL